MVAKETQVAQTEAPPEQVVYANILLGGVLIGIALLVIGFIIYVSGILPPYVPVEELPKLWGLKAHKYVEVTKSPTGWGWVSYLGKGDCFNHLGIAFLSGLTIIGFFFSLVPAYLKKKDTWYFLIALVEVVVLVLAASGVVKAGH
ncbi:DUF1634 domain-containing protein [Thermodesulfitimonas sp.]